VARLEVVPGREVEFQHAFEAAGKLIAGVPGWKALLHHFYDPFPVVEHYADVSRR
jgi:heme-degrading monooxygenase HmoA